MAGKFDLALEAIDNFGGRSKVQFGVGEEIGLDVIETPQIKPPTEVECVVKSGNATVKPSMAKGSFVVKCGNKPGAVVLEVRTKADNKVIGTKRFEVIAPSGYKAKVVKQLNGDGGIGFMAQLWLEPATVSFKWVETREGSAPWEGKGCFQQAEITEIKNGKMGGAKYAVIHPVNNKWIPCRGGKEKNISGVDTVTSAPPASWAPGGTFEWKIPQFYKVTGMSGEFTFTTGVHKEVIDATGVLKIGKFGVGHAVKLWPSA